jgi:SulP family sulfate permease
MRDHVGSAECRIEQKESVQVPHYLPKSVACLRSGLCREHFVHDLLAGVTVGIIALPLAMAFGIASIPEDVASQSGISPPAMGLYTAVIAGFLISALGGSRVQIGGPTGAFIVIIYGVASRHGLEGLMTATLMAGVIVVIMGLSRFGGMIKFIPYPVTTGFTAGIAVIIFSSQVKDFFGLQMGQVPADFLEKWQAFAEHASTWKTATFGIGAGSLLMLLLMRRLVPRIPGAIVVVIVSATVVSAFHLPVETIGSKFGGIPHSLPTPRLPTINLTLIRELIPDATTMAILIAIESLLSAVVADGMMGGRHKADCELVAQGIANTACALFGGLPATGAIARTAANVKSGGRTPIAGMVHALVLLLFMLLAAPLAAQVPLATLASVLMVVAWNMSEVGHFRALLSAPRSDVAVLLTTFGLTVFADLTVAVGVGMILASMLFMKRMADVSGVSVVSRELSGDEAELAEFSDPNTLSIRQVPDGVEVYEINGPFFFGVADRLKDTLNAIERPPAVFILRMRRVPAIDATGMHALEEFYHKCQRQGTVLLLSGVHAHPLRVFLTTGFDRTIGKANMFGGIDAALNRAREIMNLPSVSPPTIAVPEVAREMTGGI